MRVRVTLTISGTLIKIEGDTEIFNQPMTGFSNIGFWLANWHYTGSIGQNNRKGKVFIPWTSCLMIEEI